ncbi:hypothetical protein Efla_001044 [Eimeria flavescens]
MQPPQQAGMPPAYRGPQDMTAIGPGGPVQRPMQQRPGAPGMPGQMNGPQRPGGPAGVMMGGPGGPPAGPAGGRPVGNMPGLGGPPGGQQGPRPGMGGPNMGSPGMGPNRPPGGPMPVGGPMSGGPPGGAPMGGPPSQRPMGPPGGPMGAPPGSMMGGPPGGPMGAPGGMRPGGGPPGGGPMQGPGMQMGPPQGGPMGMRPMQMMRGQTGQFEGPQRPGGGGGGTGGPPDMRGPMQGPFMGGYGPGAGQPGRPDTGSMPAAQMQLRPTPKKPAQPHKVAAYKPPRRIRRQVGGGDTDKEVEEDLAAKGGLGTFKNLVVLNDTGDMGSWTGFQWKGRRDSGTTFTKICHDPEGRIWCINGNWEVGRLTNSGYKSIGLLGNELLVDLAFNPQDNALWAVNRIGELLRWSGYSWERKAQHGFHKLKGITFDRKGNLWALNTACELAVWNESAEEWDIKDVPGAVRMIDLAFDERNRLWIIGPEGHLMLLSGSKWVNYGFVGCWKMTDISFKVSKLPSSLDSETRGEKVAEKAAEAE